MKLEIRAKSHHPETKGTLIYDLIRFSQEIIVLNFLRNPVTLCFHLPPFRPILQISLLFLIFFVATYIPLGNLVAEMSPSTSQGSTQITHIQLCKTCKMPKYLSHVTHSQLQFLSPKKSSP